MAQARGGAAGIVMRTFLSQPPGAGVSSPVVEQGKADPARAARAYSSKASSMGIVDPAKIRDFAIIAHVRAPRHPKTAAWAQYP